MALNVTVATFPTGCNTAVAQPSLVQWDRGQILQFEGIELPTSYQVEFTTQETVLAIPMIGDSGGVEIPNALLQSSAPITAYLVLHEGEDDRETERWATIYVKPRKMPPITEPDPEQADIIDQTIAALQQGVSDAQGYAEEAAGSAEAADAAKEAIQDMGVAAQGAAAGTQPTVVKTVDPETGAVTLSFGIPKGDTGAAGQDGQDGQDGADGYTPVKGTDYWTAEDKAEMVGDVVSEMIDDTAGDGDTDKVWSADKSNELLSAIQDIEGAVGELETGSLSALGASLGQVPVAQGDGTWEWGRGTNIFNLADYGVEDGDVLDYVINPILQNNNSGVIYLPKGTYKIRNISWKSNFAFVGDGIGQTIIQSELSTAFQGEEVSHVIFRDFTIDSQYAQGGKGIFFLYVVDSEFRDIEIKNTPLTGFGCDFFQNGVVDHIITDNCGRSGDLSGSAPGCSGIGIGIGCYQRGNESLTISNCHANNNKQFGIFVELEQDDQSVYGDAPIGTTIVGCTAEGNRAGFGVSGCDSAVFIGCHAYKNYHAGFTYDCGTMNNNNTHGKRPKFIGCVAKENGIDMPSGYPERNNETNGHGWYIKSNFTGIELIGCNSSENLVDGIHIANGITELSIIGGTIDNNGHDGICMHGISTKCRIEPSYIHDNTASGISNDGTITKSIFKNMVIHDNATGMNNTGTLSGLVIVSDNILYDNTTDLVDFDNKCSNNIPDSPEPEPPTERTLVDEQTLTKNTSNYFTVDEPAGTKFIVTFQDVVDSQYYDGSIVTLAFYDDRDVMMEKPYDGVKISSADSFEHTIGNYNCTKINVYVEHIASGKVTIKATP